MEIHYKCTAKLYLPNYSPKLYIPQECNTHYEYLTKSLLYFSEHLQALNLSCNGCVWYFDKSEDVEYVCTWRNGQVRTINLAGNNLSIALIQDNIVSNAIYSELTLVSSCALIELMNALIKA